MKSFLFCFLSALLAVCAILPQSALGFTNSAGVSTRVTSSTQLYFFGGPKDDGSPGDYKCLDCNYVFTKGPKAWAELPDNWSCPECGSVKRRFKKIPKGSAKAAKDAPKKKGMFGF
jgi:rubredoxin